MPGRTCTATSVPAHGLKIGWPSALDDEPEHFPAQQEQQDEKQQAAADPSKIAGTQVCLVPVKAKQKPQEHQNPEQERNGHGNLFFRE
jgi:hypothetical protein